MVVQQPAMIVQQPMMMGMPQPMMMGGMPQQPQGPPTPTFYGREPMYISCPRCHKATTTMTETECSSKQWTMCFVLACTTGCCCIPFCCSDWYNIVHKCPECQQVVGKNIVQ